MKTERAVLDEESSGGGDARRAAWNPIVLAEANPDEIGTRSQASSSWKPLTGQKARSPGTDAGATPAAAPLATTASALR
jgi:hypothetical protein